MARARCITSGLVGGEGFAVDASLIQADANKHRSIPGGEWNRDIETTAAPRPQKDPQDGQYVLHTRLLQQNRPEAADTGCPLYVRSREAGRTRFARF
jgi:hypothetical protein